MADLDALLADLAAEGDELDQLVAPLTAEQWATATPSVGWTVATQIAHLTWTDGVSIVAATDPAEFGRQLEAAMDRIETFVDDAAAELAQLPSAELLAQWRQGRIDLVAALAAGPPGQKLPWFGPPMSAASMATARLMETWAHGQDVADALGVTRTPTARLRHIAHIGVRTRNFAYVSNGLDLPAEEFRVELTGPDGGVWTWGPDDAADRLTGPAVDFALLVTQRRHPDDLSLQAEGVGASQWLRIAQAFAGPPGGGRVAGQFPATGSGGADGAQDAGARDAAGNDAGNAS